MEPKKFACPDCGGHARVYYYPHGGGTTVCYKCGKRLFVVPVGAAVLMWAEKNPHRFDSQHFRKYGKGLTPPKISETVRHMSNVQGVAINGF